MLYEILSLFFTLIIAVVSLWEEHLKKNTRNIILVISFVGAFGFGIAGIVKQSKKDDIADESAKENTQALQIIGEKMDTINGRFVISINNEKVFQKFVSTIIKDTSKYNRFKLDDATAKAINKRFDSIAKMASLANKDNPQFDEAKEGEFYIHAIDSMLKVDSLKKGSNQVITRVGVINYQIANLQYKIDLTKFLERHKYPIAYGYEDVVPDTSNLVGIKFSNAFLEVEIMLGKLPQEKHTVFEMEP